MPEVSMISDLRGYLHFVLYYARAKLEAESFRHFAGYFWWILDPIFTVSIYYFLFKVVLNRGEDKYIMFLFVGLVAWKWFSEGLSKAAMSISGNISLIKRIRIRKDVFPVVDSLVVTWKFLVVFALILVVYAFWAHTPTWNHLWIPVLILAEFLLILGLGIFLASILPLFPDGQFLLTYSLRLLFYPTGVIFSLTRVPEEYRKYLQLNPMTGLIKNFRDVIMYGNSVELAPILYSITLGLLFGAIGLKIIQHYDKEYPKYE